MLRIVLKNVIVFLANVEEDENEWDILSSKFVKFLSIWFLIDFNLVSNLSELL